jgi:hypothetical protein
VIKIGGNRMWQFVYVLYGNSAAQAAVLRRQNHHKAGAYNTLVSWTHVDKSIGRGTTLMVS